MSRSCSCSARPTACSSRLSISYELQLWIFRLLFFVAPVAAYLIAGRWARALAGAGEHPLRDIDAILVEQPRPAALEEPRERAGTGGPAD